MFRNHPVLRCRSCGVLIIYPNTRWKFSDDSKIYCDRCIGDGESLSVLIRNDDGWREADWDYVQDDPAWWDCANIREDE